MFATSDWEPDVPKGNISFGKKPFKGKSEKKNITSTFSQNVDNNHDVDRGFPTTQSTAKPKKNKNKSNHKKSVAKSLQGHDSEKTLPVNKIFKTGMTNGSDNLNSNKIKPNKVVPSQESLKNIKKEKKEKRAKEQNIKTENLKAVLNQFSNSEGEKDSQVKLLSMSDKSKPKKTKVKHLKNKPVALAEPADMSNNAIINISNVTSEGKDKKNKLKNPMEQNNVVVSEVKSTDDRGSSSMKTTPGSFVRNPNLNNELDKSDKTVNGSNELTKNQKKRQRKNKRNNINDAERESNAVNKPEEISRKRKQDTTNDDEKVKSKKIKQSKDIPKLEQTGSTSDTEEYNDFSAPKAKVSGKKEKLKTKLKNMLSMAERSPIVTTGNKLRDRMMEKLKSAQFRYLNEKLYTSSGTEAQQLFQSDPVAFQTYHEGYQQQVKKWPVNPIDVIAKLILKMPKTTKIADMGCGEAVLSKRVPHAVRSFDLVATSPNVEACDMAHTPLLTTSMDVVVYCLALMGTDLTQYLLEANRVLKMGGLLYIAEVESRFDKPEDFTESVQRLGFKLLKLDKSHEVFFFMQFRKFQDPPTKKSKLPALSLKPCLYKRR